MTSPLLHVVQAAIKKLDNNKSADIDIILVEYLKSGGDTMAKSIPNICNQVWKTGEIRGGSR